MKKLILASSSPRRQEILKKMGLKFEMRKTSYEEDMNIKKSPEKLVEYLSMGKAKSAIKNNEKAIILAADTIVVYNKKIFGKPKTKKEAEKMLKILSGKKHKIITGVSIIDTENNFFISFHETTNIFMKKLNPKTIKTYIETDEPLDKAGAYALQEKGAVLIEKIEGDFFNAMGLPISKISEKLKKIKINIL